MDWNELFNALMPMIISAAGVILTALGSYLAVQVKKFLDTGEKRAMAEVTVKYVEQVGKLMGSEEKLKLAMDTMIENLNNAGIKFTELELRVLIESAVNGFKKEYTTTAPVESIGSE